MTSLQELRAELERVSVQVPRELPPSTLTQLTKAGLDMVAALAFNANEHHDGHTWQSFPVSTKSMRERLWLVTQELLHRGWFVCWQQVGGARARDTDPWIRVDVTSMESHRDAVAGVINWKLNMPQRDDVTWPKHPSCRCSLTP